jgi:phosphate transport system protein
MAVVSGAHTIKKFDEELATLRDLVLRMGGLVEEQLLRAVEAIERGDAELARSVVQRDREIDRIELKADEEIAQLLALRSPLGVDLRTLLTFSKTVNDLERIGDEVKKVARFALRLQEDTGASELRSMGGEVGGMARRAQEMLHRALDSLVRLDLVQARAIKEQDRKLDADFDAGMARLREQMAAEPQSIALGLELAFALKALERIGDHAENIGQYVFYLVEGRDVRHPKVNPAAKA